jgi:hypothetical protein
MSKKLPIIEFACSHNNGRSPLAGGFGNEYLNELSENGYEVVSSGTHIAEIEGMLRGEIPVPNAIAAEVLEKALERGIFDERKVIEGILADEAFQETEAQDHVLRAAKKFVREEGEFKEEAFKRFNLGNPKSTRDQTIANPNTRILLGMGGMNVEKMPEIYKGRKLPIVGTLLGYASGNPGQEFKAAFGGTLNDYLAMGEVIRDGVRRSVDRFLESQ